MSSQESGRTSKVKNFLVVFDEFCISITTINTTTVSVDEAIADPASRPSVFFVVHTVMFYSCLRVAGS